MKTIQKFSLVIFVVVQLLIFVGCADTPVPGSSGKLLGDPETTSVNIATEAYTEAIPETENETVWQLNAVEKTENLNSFGSWASDKQFIYCSKTTYTSETADRIAESVEIKQYTYDLIVTKTTNINVQGLELRNIIQISYSDNIIGILADNNLAQGHDIETTMGAATLIFADWQGNITGTVLLDETLLPGISATNYVISNLVLFDNLCILSTEKDIYALSDKGNVEWTIMTDDYIDRLFVSSSGLYYSTLYDENNVILIDTNSYSPANTVVMGDIENYYGCWNNYTYLSYQDGLVWGCDSKSKVKELLGEIPAPELNKVQLVVYKDDNVFVLYRNALNEVEYGRLVQTEMVGDQFQKLTIGRFSSVTEELEAQAVSAFETSNAFWEIEYVDYSGPEELNVSMAAGDIPDIIRFDSMQTETYTRHGLLLNLYDFMEKDASISKDGILEIYRSQYEMEGALYAISPVFGVKYTLGNPMYFNNKTYTFSDLVAIAENLPDDMYITGLKTPESLFLELIERSLSYFVDFKSAQCNFSCKELLDLVKFCKFDSIGLDNISPLTDGECLIRLQQISCISEFLYYRNINGDDAVVLNCPGSQNLYIPGTLTYGITSLGNNPEKAWTFVSYMLSDTVQNSITNEYFPVLSTALDEAIDRARDSGCEEDSLADLEKLLTSPISSYRYDSMILNIIEEEMDIYWAGRQTMDQTARFIQNRVKIYLSEQS